MARRPWAPVVAVASRQEPASASPPGATTAPASMPASRRQAVRARSACPPAHRRHQAVRLQVPLSLIILDIDHFKLFNDGYGHQAGDTCLREVATALTSRVKRAGDLITRYGGEEFAIVLFHTPMNDGLNVSESLREAVADLELKHEFSPNGIVTVSLGGATVIPSLDAKVEDLVKSADEALYRAKAKGRNRVEWSMLS